MAQGSTAIYKLRISPEQGGTKSYLGGLGRTMAYAFQDRHHRPLGHPSAFKGNDIRSITSTSPTSAIASIQRLPGSVHPDRLLW